MSDGEERKRNLVDGYHHRNLLPHLKREGGTYFVTFRLAGTLPAKVVVQLKAERARILDNARTSQRPLNWIEQRKLFEWYSSRVDALLDSGYGSCWLAKPEIAHVVSQSLKHFTGIRYDLVCWVVMPNHVHVVVRPLQGYDLSGILKSWKGFTGSAANRMLGRVGESFWQSESYDHLVRSSEELESFIKYTLWNPVKAGFCDVPEHWRWSSAAEAVDVR